MYCRQTYFNTNFLNLLKQLHSSYIEFDLQTRIYIGNYTFWLNLKTTATLF